MVERFTSRKLETRAREFFKSHLLEVFSILYENGDADAGREEGVSKKLDQLGEVLSEAKRGVSENEGFTNLLGTAKEEVTRIKSRFSKLVTTLRVVSNGYFSYYPLGQAERLLSSALEGNYVTSIESAICKDVIKGFSYLIAREFSEEKYLNDFITNVEATFKHRKSLHRGHVGEDFMDALLDTEYMPDHSEESLVRERLWRLRDHDYGRIRY